VSETYTEQTNTSDAGAGEQAQAAEAVDSSSSAERGDLGSGQEAMHAERGDPHGHDAAAGGDGGAEQRSGRAAEAADVATRAERGGLETPSGGSDHSVTEDPGTEDDEGADTDDGGDPALDGDAGVPAVISSTEGAVDPSDGIVDVADRSASQGEDVQGVQASEVDGDADGEVVEGIQASQVEPVGEAEAVKGVQATEDAEDVQGVTGEEVEDTDEVTEIAKGVGDAGAELTEENLEGTVPEPVSRAAGGLYGAYQVVTGEKSAGEALDEQATKATHQPGIGPAIAAGQALAHGGDLEDAADAAGRAFVTNLPLARSVQDLDKAYDAAQAGDDREAAKHIVEAGVHGAKDIINIAGAIAGAAEGGGRAGPEPVRAPETPKAPEPPRAPETPKAPEVSTAGDTPPPAAAVEGDAPPASAAAAEDATPAVPATDEAPPPAAAAEDAPPAAAEESDTPPPAAAGTEDTPPPAAAGVEEPPASGVREVEAAPEVRESEEEPGSGHGGSGDDPTDRRGQEILKEFQEAQGKASPEAREADILNEPDMYEAGEPGATDAYPPGMTEAPPGGDWQARPLDDPAIRGEMEKARDAMRQIPDRTGMGKEHGEGKAQARTEDGRTWTESGWTDRPNFDGAVANTDRVIVEGGAAGRGPGDHPFDPGVNPGEEGQYNASHAEKQAAADAPGQAIGVDRPMCPDCVEDFQQHAVDSGQPSVVSDPEQVHVFMPDGRHLTESHTGRGID